MFKKSLLESRMEFLWEMYMIDTRTTMKCKYKKDKYECPHCDEGRKRGALETTSHLLVSCLAYSDLREGCDPELEARANILPRAISRRNELEIKLKSRIDENQARRSIYRRYRKL